MIMEKNGGRGVNLDVSTFFTGLTTNLTQDVDTAKAHASVLDA